MYSKRMGAQGKSKRGVGDKALGDLIIEIATAISTASATTTTAGSNGSSTSMPVEEEPISFKDAVGRKFTFPFKSVKTWEGMEELVKQAFMHIEIIGPHVAEGHYDLVNPDGHILLPQVWEKTIKPGVLITMYMWPIPEPRPAPFNPRARPCPPGVWQPGPPPSFKSKKSIDTDLESQCSSVYSDNESEIYLVERLVKRVPRPVIRFAVGMLAMFMMLIPTILLWKVNSFEWQVGILVISVSLYALGATQSRLGSNPDRYTSVALYSGFLMIFLALMELRSRN